MNDAFSPALAHQEPVALQAPLHGRLDHRLADRSGQRLLGAFYTSSEAAGEMARWVLRTPRDRVLEPSFGGGAFIDAVAEVRRQRGWRDVRTFGAELVEATFADSVRRGVLPAEDAFLGDFLALEPFPVDAVIGNPPYVRLRHLPGEQEARATRVAAEALGAPMEAAGSVWMPFVLHALRFLRRGGRCALVLPLDLTYVKYARALWKVLGGSFGSLRLVRVHERIFPDILQDVVVLLADGFGETTTSVEFVAVDRSAEFAESVDRAGRSVPVADIARGDRAFMRALLSPRLLALLDSKILPFTKPVRDFCAFNIGYVSGHKGFFHPPRDLVERFSLPQSSLRPALTSSRQLTGVGVRTSALEQTSHLYLPSGELSALSPGERRYIAQGETDGVHLRYKCRVRTPWHVVPGVRVPDLVMSVFSERPVVLLNDAGLVATNSLLCGFLRKGTAEAFVSSWYTSLTLLMCEMEVHSLGGGVLVLIPGEVGKVRVAPITTPARGHITRLHGLLRAGDVAGAYSLGDENILATELGLSAEEQSLIQEGVATLRHWRLSARGGESVEESADPE